MDYNIYGVLPQISLQKFSDRKLFSLLVADAWERFGDYERAMRIRNCGDELVFAYDENGEARLVSANFCRDRVCSMCAWRRSLRLYAQVSTAMNLLEETEKYSYIFLTLTVQNVGRQDLGYGIDQLVKGYKRLFERKEVEQAVEGWFRALEITYNAEKDSFHPHIHAVCVVKRSYFTSRYYLSHATWSSLWQQCCRLNYTPIVDIRKVSNKQDSGYVGAVAEIAKYAVKPSDAINLETGEVRDDVIIAMSKALFGRRLIGWGGVLREAHRATGDAVAVREDLTDVRPDVVKGLVRYQWDGKGYKMGM